MKVVDNLANNAKIVEKRKIYFIIWSIIIALGFVVAIIFSVANGSPFNLSTDFTGSYSVSVQLGERLTDDNVDNYRREITDIIQGVEIDGVGATVKSVQRYGENATSGLKFKYLAVGDDEFMDELGDQIVEAIEDRYFEDTYSGQVVEGGLSSPMINSETVSTVVMTVLLAVVLVMIYLSFRFGFINSMAIILNMLLDLLVIFAFVAIVRVEIGSAFIVALLASAVISILNSTIVFDRIREGFKNKENADLTPNMITNSGVRSSLSRSFSALVLGLITVLLLTVIAVPNFRVFMVPLIVGVVASAISSILVAPSLFAAIATRHPDLLQKHAFSKRFVEFFKNKFGKNRPSKAKKTKSVINKKKQTAK